MQDLETNIINAIAVVMKETSSQKLKKKNKKNKMLYLIGLGLSESSISVAALEAIKSCDKVYLETYTVDFPYEIKNLESSIKTKIIPLEREKVENESVIKEAKKQNIALLVYGNPLSATTHIQLIIAAKKQKVKYKIIHSESILNAIAESGLQLYKFGKTASMPKFSPNYAPDSFLDIILQNEKIKAHTLLLTDIGLSSKEAIKQLEKVSEKRNVKFDKIIICSQLGKNSKIFYDNIKNLKTKNIPLPFCIIIPSELHFIEKEALELLSE